MQCLIERHTHTHTFSSITTGSQCESMQQKWNGWQAMERKWRCVLAKRIWGNKTPQRWLSECAGISISYVSSAWLIGLFVIVAAVANTDTATDKQQRPSSQLTSSSRNNDGSQFWNHSVVLGLIIRTVKMVARTEVWRKSFKVIIGKLSQ